MLYAPSHPNIIDDEIIKPMSNMLHANSKLKMFREQKKKTQTFCLVAYQEATKLHFI